MTVASDWTLITVTYNSARALEAAWSAAELGDARWIVVDNASTDDSVAVAKSLGAEVVELRDNRGFSAANNVGLERVATDWVAFVNPDLTITCPEDLDHLASVSAANGGALVAPQLLNPDGTEQPNGRGLPYLLDKVANRGVRLPGSRLHEYVRTGLDGPTYVAWLTGAAVAGPVDVLRRLDGWDERFFLYYEDVDLGLRSWTEGVPVVVDPSVRWVHAWQRATKGLDLMAWRVALPSVRTFFRTYPELLHRGARQRAGILAQLNDQIWSAAKSG